MSEPKTPYGSSEQYGGSEESAFRHYNFDSAKTYDTNNQIKYNPDINTGQGPTVKNANVFKDQITNTAGLTNTVTPAFTIGSTNYSLIGNSSSFLKDGEINLDKLQKQFGDTVKMEDFKNINGQLYHIHNQNFLERNGQTIGAGFATLGAINSLASTIDSAAYHNGMVKVYKKQNEISQGKLDLSNKQYDDLVAKRNKIDSQLNR